MSRRFKNRHRKVQADPNARAPASLDHQPVELDDSNSYVDPLQPDRRIPNELNTRAYVKAGEDELEEETDTEADDE